MLNSGLIGLISCNTHRDCLQPEYRGYDKSQAAGHLSSIVTATAVTIALVLRVLLYVRDP